MINISKLYCGKAGQSDDLRYKRNDLGPIVVFNCTAACNLKCAHCYSATEKNTAELDTSQAKKMISDLAEANCPVLLFSGGEPLLRKDLFELMDYATTVNLKTVISTNGTLIDDVVARKLKEAKIGYVGISIDGEGKIHDRFRGVAGAFKGMMNGVKNCIDAGIRTGFRFTITTQNLGEVENIFKLAAENNVRRLCFYHLIRMGRAAGADCLPSAEQTRGTIDRIIDLTKEYVGAGKVDEVLTVGNHADGAFLLEKMKAESHSNYENALKLLTINGGNKIGEKIACVSWDGTVYADQFWRNYPIANCMDKSFGDIWYGDNELLVKLRDKKNFAAEECKKCKWFDICRGNYRFLNGDASMKNWRNEPACYLTERQRAKK